MIGTGRARLLAVIGLVTLLTAAGVAVPAAACACGGAAPPDGAEVRVDHEVAIVRWNGLREEIVMRLAMTGDTGDTGLVVPTPTPATVDLGDSAVFEALQRELEPVVITEWDWWGSFGFGEGSAGGAPDGGTVVLDQVQLGPIQATTLASDDLAGLNAWLDENGYVLPEAVAAQLGPYVEDGWAFVALKLTADVPFDGELDPIRFTFDSEQLVYPMRMSAAATTPQSVRLYLPSDHRQEVAGSQTFQDVVYAGNPQEPEVAALGGYLTVVDLTFTDPATINQDLVVSQAADDTTVTPTVIRHEVAQLGGIPLGWLIVVGVVILVFAIIAVIVLILLRRRGNPQPQ
jgi:hypothetical protein